MNCGEIKGVIRQRAQESVVHKYTSALIAVRVSCNVVRYMATRHSQWK